MNLNRTKYFDLSASGTGLEGKIGEAVMGTINMLGWRDEAYYDSDDWRGHKLDEFTKEDTELFDKINPMEYFIRLQIQDNSQPISIILEYLDNLLFFFCYN